MKKNIYLLAFTRIIIAEIGIIFIKYSRVLYLDQIIDVTTNKIFIRVFSAVVLVLWIFYLYYIIEAFDDDLEDFFELDNFFDFTHFSGIISRWMVLLCIINIIYCIVSIFRGQLPEFVAEKI